MEEKLLYGVDLVWCIDGTKTPLMEKILDVIKNNNSHFWKRYLKAMESEGKDVGSVRIKVIVFRDFNYQPHGIEESKFFLMPEEEQQLVQYVKDIVLTEGDENSNYSLEALATSLKSKWSNKEKRNRDIIVMFSDKEAFPLQMDKDFPYYPEGMPKDLAELSEWWEGEIDLNNSYKAKYGRLVAFVPNRYPWNEIGSWNRYWPTYIVDENKEFDFQEVIDLLTGSF